MPVVFLQVSTPKDTSSLGFAKYSVASGVYRWICNREFEVGDASVNGLGFAPVMSAQIVDQSPFLWLANFPFFRYGIGGRNEEFGEQLAIRHSNSGTNNSTKLAFVVVLRLKLGNLL